VQVTHQFTIPESMLVVPQHLTDYEVDVDLDWKDEDDTPILGTKKLKINNGLKVGDKVAIMRKQGGQSYTILDRV
jgi:hypothetical protein